MRALLSTLQRVPEFEDLLLRIDAGRCPVAASGLSPVHRAFVAAGIALRLERPVVLLCPEEVECAKLSRDLEALLEVPVLQLPGREFNFHTAATVSHQWEHKRLAVFRAMATRKAPVVVSTVEDLPYLDSAFEVASAMGTVGLTTGITPSSSRASKVLCRCSERTGDSTSSPVRRIWATVRLYSAKSLS